MAEVRLIDANALLEHFNALQNLLGEYCECFKNASGELSTEWHCVESIVENAPTIDAVEVVHAYWMDGIICSHCRSTKARPWAAYLEQRANTFCHVCGAKMDGGKNDGDG